MESSFGVNPFTEDELEKAIIDLFKQQGYEYKQGGSIHRRYDEILIADDLGSFLKSIYGDELSSKEVEKILHKLSDINSTPLYSGNREAFRLVTEGFNLIRDDASETALHINFIDFDEIENNTFKIVNQYSVQDRHIRRPDLLVFVNGIPVVIFEFKSAIKEHTTIHDAWEQITIRYARDIPKLLKYCFLSVVSDGANSRIGSVFSHYEYYYAWNKANEQDKTTNGISSLLTMMHGVFAKDRLLQILRDFVFYPDDSKKDEVIVCRYPQFFGATKMLDNIKLHMRPAGDGKGGTYFGATGCGKTYTMLFLSRLIALRDNKTFSNPTIIIIEDREDLDTQTSELFSTAKKYLHEEDVRSIESRDDLEVTLKNKPSGGVYITTIQKFCERTGLLSDRNNIICISDEAHRTQSGIGAKLKRTSSGVYTTYGFAHYLRTSFPNATYCGFTGTPIDETTAVFGKIVDRYTMKESSDDGITVRIAYEPRLARVVLSEKKAKQIEEYYEKCADEGSSQEQIEESKRAMSQLDAILGDADVIENLAHDIAKHYESICNEKPNVIQKAMIVCPNRKIAFSLLKAIGGVRPDWTVKRKAENEEKLTKEQLDKLEVLPKINLVATQMQNDPEDLYEICGSNQYRKMLDKQFKNINSNFKIAIVVDMWITGFDVPSLAVMYIYKPIQKHTLIQTISRVNRVFEGKDKGLVLDYIGIGKNLKEAIKQYGNPEESPIDELKETLSIFRNHLNLVDQLMHGFDASRFYKGEPLERLYCLNEAAEFVQVRNNTVTRFMGLSRRLKNAYLICFPSGELSDEETAKAQFYLAIRSIIYKQTNGDTRDAEVMNSIVEAMVSDAIECIGIEDIMRDNESVDLFSYVFIEELKKVKLPNTKFNALLKLLRKAISTYSHNNKVKAIAFDERLRRVVDEYNNRDRLNFTNEVVSDFVDGLSTLLLKIMDDLNNDRKSFEKMGITYDTKAFYDILVNIRDTHGFAYDDSKCIELAKKIKEIVDKQTQYVDWFTRDDIKGQLNMELTVLLYKNSYPPEWDEEVYEKVMEQANNFEKYN